MSELENKGAVIKENGRHCVVLFFDAQACKYKVDFRNGFVGWYHKCELIMDDDSLSDKNPYFKVCDGDDFKNVYVCPLKEAKEGLDSLIESFNDRAEGDSDCVLCFKVCEMTDKEFENLEEFRGF
jgi:hypothetical protein